jgi:hypothetical protein
VYVYWDLSWCRGWFFLDYFGNQCHYFSLYKHHTTVK